MISFNLIDFLTLLSAIIVVYLVLWSVCLGASLLTDSNVMTEVIGAIWKYGKLILNWLVYAYVALSTTLLYAYELQNALVAK